MLIAQPSFSLLYILDEVISPTMTIKAVGLFLGSLTLYILNKMKDTIFNGQKNNKYYHNIRNKNYSIASYVPFANRTRILHKNNFSCFSLMLRKQRYFTINKIRAMNRIGPHNLNLYSTLNISQDINDLKLDNNFITGFTDAEGSFMVLILKDKNYKLG